MRGLRTALRDRRQTGPHTDPSHRNSGDESLSLIRRYPSALAIMMGEWALQQLGSSGSRRSSGLLLPGWKSRLPAEFLERVRRLDGQVMQVELRRNRGTRWRNETANLLYPNRPDRRRPRGAIIFFGALLFPDFFDGFEELLSVHRFCQVELKAGHRALIDVRLHPVAAQRDAEHVRIVAERLYDFVAISIG